MKLKLSSARTRSALDESTVARSKANADEVVPYERELRVLGARFDSDACSSVRFLEVADGFMVSSQGSNAETEAVDHLVKHEDLRKGKTPELHRGRRFHRDSHAPKHLAKYEDILAALGHRLEHDGAYTLLFDEVDDSFVVTYQFCNAELDYMLHKRHLVVNRQDVPELIRSSKGQKAPR